MDISKHNHGEYINPPIQFFLNKFIYIYILNNEKT